MKTRLGAAIDRICSGTITRESDALERLGALTDDARLVVDALSEAQARIEALEWLVEVQDLRVHRIINAGEWAQKNAGTSVREAWKRRENSNYELRDTLKEARAAAEV